LQFRILHTGKGPTETKKKTSQELTSQDKDFTFDTQVDHGMFWHIDNKPLPISRSRDSAVTVLKSKPKPRF